MKAVILSAGRGSRMGRLTSGCPKSLLTIAGRRLLDRQVAALTRAGVSEIAVVTGWRAEAFRGISLQFFHNADWSRSSMVQSLACADNWLMSGTTIVSYGDIVFSPAAVKAVKAEPGIIVIAYDPDWLSQWSNRFANPLADAETLRLSPSGMVTEIGSTAQSVAEIQGQYLGLLKFEPDGWLLVRDALETACRQGNRTDMTGLLGTLAARQNVMIRAIPVAGPWHEFDSPHDIQVGRSCLADLDRHLFTTG
jgi:choline kinase